MSNNGQGQSYLSTVDRVVLAALLALGAVFGVFVWVGADDPSFADLQRIVGLMVVAAWVVGLTIAWAVVRRLESQVVRLAVLLSVPVMSILALVVWARFG